MELHERCFSRSLPRLQQSATANYRQIGGNLTKLYHTHDPAVGVSTLLRSWSAGFASISHAPSWKAINYVVARYLPGISSPLRWRRWWCMWRQLLQWEFTMCIWIWCGYDLPAISLGLTNILYRRLLVATLLGNTYYYLFNMINSALSQVQGKLWLIFTTNMFALLARWCSSAIINPLIPTWSNEDDAIPTSTPPPAPHQFNQQHHPHGSSSFYSGVSLCFFIRTRGGGIVKGDELHITLDGKILKVSRAMIYGSCCKFFCKIWQMRRG